MTTSSEVPPTEPQGPREPSVADQYAAMAYGSLAMMMKAEVEANRATNATLCWIGVFLGLLFGVFGSLFAGPIAWAFAALVIVPCLIAWVVYP